MRIQAHPHIISTVATTVLVLLLGHTAQGRGELLAEALRGPLAGVEEVVFAVRAPGRDGHWYANFGYWADNEQRMLYGPEGGELSALNLRTGRLRKIFDDPKGGIRDPHVHYDGTKILFSYRTAGSLHYHLYEINVDGSGLKQLTDGPFDDLEAIYLPDGEILFCSSRCKRWVQCWHTQVAVRYRCAADGSNIRLISSNVEHDNTPWMLPDGRVLYMRWEYVDRSRVQFHHLWTSNPDGTGEMVYYGNMHPGTVMLDAKPVPGTERVASIFSPGHGQKGHAGPLMLVENKAGPDARIAARQIGRGNQYRDPYPVTENCFFVAEHGRILLLDGHGRSEELYSLPGNQRHYWCHEPRPLQSRKREPVIADRVDRTQKTGHLILADVRNGRRMDGVKEAEIKKLLVLETLPKPINHSGTMEPISLGGTFTLPRILGTVPVEPDGSAYFEVPALRSLFFVALDENDLAVKRMQSFVNVMPGETTSCVGCHENRTDTVPPSQHRTLMALKRRPRRADRITPIPDVPDVFDFPRDIQPILDRRCVTCHRAEKRDGRVNLTGDRGPIYSHAYATLMTSHNLVSHGRDAGGNKPPRTLGSSASRIMGYLDGSHHDATLTPHEIMMVRLWIESGAPYAGTYAALGTGMVSLPPVPAALRERCNSCHRSPPAHGELLYNLTHPEKSLALLAPLAKSAGGLGLCAKKAGSKDVFRDTGDEDYRRTLKQIRDRSNQLNRIKRFDMPDFKPNRHYVREMKRYGTLPASFNLARDSIDVYQTDQAYWKSFWCE